MVHNHGFNGLDDLSEEAKSYIAPLPIKFDPELPGYRNMLDMMGDSKHATDSLIMAQAIKDATMAHFILENWSEGKVFIHYNGAYHSENFEGIVWYLKDNKEDLNILTIHMVEQDDIEGLEEENLETANFIICVPSDMTKTNR